MIKLSVKSGKLDLAEHSGDATLSELAQAVEEYTSSKRGARVSCQLCGECCGHGPVLGLDMKLEARREGMDVRAWAAARLIPPEFPDMAARQKLIAEFIRNAGVSEIEATVLYEYNQSEALTFKHNEQDRCFYQKDNLCTRHTERLFICKLYQCSFGPKLQELEEMIVAQGTWHAWHLLGAVPEEAIKHNPFLKAVSYNDVPVKAFEYGLEGALNEMFSYF